HDRAACHRPDPFPFPKREPWSPERRPPWVAEHPGPAVRRPVGAVLDETRPDDTPCWRPGSRRPTSPFKRLPSPVSATGGATFSGRRVYGLFDSDRLGLASAVGEGPAAASAARTIRNLQARYTLGGNGRTRMVILREREGAQPDTTPPLPPPPDRGAVVRRLRLFATTVAALDLVLLVLAGLGA